MTDDTDTNTVRALNDALTGLLEDMPRPEGKEDWSYRDLPRMREDLFDRFVELVGAENIEWITRAEYRHEDGLYKRGQLWVSPEGLARCARASTVSDS